MNLKFVLGILVPLIVIISLVVLSTVNVGFSIQKQSEKSIDFNVLFTNENRAGEIKIQTITVKNDYFLSKKIELPRVMACLYDKEGKVKSQNLYVRYNEGISSEIPETQVAGELFALSSSRYGYSYYTTSKVIDVPADSQKDVKVMVQPHYTYNYNNKKDESNYEYDEILIIEPEKKQDYYSYDSCSNLDDKDLEHADRISISISQAVINERTKKQAILNQLREQLTAKGVDIYKCENDQYPDNCYSQIALDTANVKVCEIISDIAYRDSCYFSVAYAAGNMSICNLISARSRYLLNDCINQFNSKQVFFRPISS